MMQKLAQHIPPAFLSELGQQKIYFLFWSSKYNNKPIYLKKDGTSSPRSFMYSSVCGIMD